MRSLCKPRVLPWLRGVPVLLFRVLLFRVLLKTGFQILVAVSRFVERVLLKTGFQILAEFRPGHPLACASGLYCHPGILLARNCVILRLQRPFRIDLGKLWRLG